MAQSFRTVVFRYCEIFLREPILLFCCGKCVLEVLMPRVSAEVVAIGVPVDHTWLVWPTIELYLHSIRQRHVSGCLWSAFTDCTDLMDPTMQNLRHSRDIFHFRLSG